MSTTNTAPQTLTVQSIDESWKKFVSNLRELESENRDKPEQIKYNAQSQFLYSEAQRLIKQLKEVCVANLKMERELSEARSEADGLRTKLANVTASPSGVELSDLRERATRAEKNVARLESLCGLSGIPADQAIIPVMPGTGAGRRADLTAQLSKETDPLKRNEIANELRRIDKATYAKKD